MSLEPIRRVWGDDHRSNEVVGALNEMYQDHLFYPTPPFYFTDYHITKVRPNGRENYVGDLEVKWLRTDSSYQVSFPFQKLAKMLIAPPYSEDPNIYHRICFRFSDGLLLIPAFELRPIVPEFTVRGDTQERDLNVLFYAETFKEKYWIERIVSEPKV
jgi:hypothetical protein